MWRRPAARTMWSCPANVLSASPETTQPSTSARISGASAYERIDRIQRGSSRRLRGSAADMAAPMSRSSPTMTTVTWTMTNVICW